MNEPDELVRILRRAERFDAITREDYYRLQNELYPAEPAAQVLPSVQPPPAKRRIVRKPWIRKQATGEG
jgi:hypothetical protein